MRKPRREIWKCAKCYWTQTDCFDCAQCGREYLAHLGIFEEDVYIYGNVEIGAGVDICGPADINGNLCSVKIGDGCDIGAFTAINCASSHKRCLGLAEEIERKPIVLEAHVFVGSHCLILGGAHIGHHSVVAGYTRVDPGIYPPWSLIYGSHPTQVKRGFYDPSKIEGRYDRNLYRPENGFIAGSFYPPGA